MRAGKTITGIVGSITCATACVFALAVDIVSNRFGESTDFASTCFEGAKTSLSLIKEGLTGTKSLETKAPEEPTRTSGFKNTPKEEPRIFDFKNRPKGAESEATRIFDFKDRPKGVESEATNASSG